MSWGSGRKQKDFTPRRVDAEGKGGKRGCLNEKRRPTRAAALSRRNYGNLDGQYCDYVTSGGTSLPRQETCRIVSFIDA